MHTQIDELLCVVLQAQGYAPPVVGQGVAGGDSSGVWGKRRRGKAPYSPPKGGKRNEGNEE